MLTIRAPAKLNLHVQVLGRRGDGFHEVRTLLQSIDLHDELWAEPAPEGELTLRVEPEGAVPGGDENLVLRAARALWQACGRKPGARLGLSKRIPVGGGLGGGSADAAATLVLLEGLWSLALSRAALHRLASELGSDVPFFLDGGLALGVGRGDEVFALPDLPELGVVVAAPETLIPTVEVYQRLDPRLTWRRPDATVYAFAAGLDGELRWGALTNDLQPVVLEGWPEVAELLEDLQGLREQQALYSAVTGAGSAVFAVFPNRGEAERAAETLRSHCFVHVGVTLTRERSRLRAQGVEGGS